MPEKAQTNQATLMCLASKVHACDQQLTIAHDREQGLILNQRHIARVLHQVVSGVYLLL